MNKKVRLIDQNSSEHRLFDLVTYIKDLMDIGVKIIIYQIRYDDACGIGFTYELLDKDNIFVFKNKKLTRISEISDDIITLHWYLHGFECCEEEKATPSANTMFFIKFYADFVTENEPENFDLANYIKLLTYFEEKPLPLLPVFVTKNGSDHIRKIRSEENLASQKKEKKQNISIEDLATSMNEMQVSKSACPSRRNSA